MSGHDDDNTRAALPEEIRGDILEDVKRRHPAWIGRLETDLYFPIAVLGIAELRGGDIVDVRDFGLDAIEEMAYLEIARNGIRSDFHGVYSIAGTLPDGRDFIIGRPDGLPMKRRKAVRYARRLPI